MYIYIPRSMPMSGGSTPSCTTLAWFSLLAHKLRSAMTACSCISTTVDDNSSISGLPLPLN